MPDALFTFDNLKERTKDFCAYVPHAPTDIEQRLIGSIMVKPDILSDVILLIQPEDIYDELARQVYSGMLKLYGDNQPFDIYILTRFLCDNKIIAENSQFFVWSLMENVATEKFYPIYCSIIKECSNRRKLEGIGASTMSRSTSGESSELIIDELDLELIRLKAKNENDSKPISELVNAELQAIQDKTLDKGIPTGYSDLDSYLQFGFKKGQMIVLGGRPSIGKSSLALNIAERIAANYKTAYFSLEMAKSELTNRLLCGKAHVTKEDIEQATDETFQKLSDAKNVIYKLNLNIYTISPLTPLSLKAELKRTKDKNGLDFAVVDYLQLMDYHQRTDSLYHKTTLLSQAIKQIAIDVDIPILVLSQLSRKLEDRFNKRPILSDLKESGSIEQDADVVMFLYREWEYMKDFKKKMLPTLQNFAELAIKKARSAKTGNVILAFYPQFTQFEQLTTEAQSNYLELINPKDGKDEQKTN